MLICAARLLADQAVMADSGPTWGDPLVVATLILAGVTLALGGGTLAMAWYTRRSVLDAVKAREVLAESADAARQAAQAGARQAEGTEKLVQVTAQSMKVISQQAASTEELARLTRREARPLLVYSDGPFRVEPIPGSDTQTRCDVTLRNYGGFAIVDEGTLRGLGGSMRAAPSLTWEGWQGSSIARRLVPPGEDVEIRGGITTRPEHVPGTSSPPAIYVRVRYTDRHGEQPTITYLCLWQQGQEWQVVGQALDHGDGRPLRTGHGWDSFVPRPNEPPWPARGETWPGETPQFW